MKALFVSLAVASLLAFAGRSASAAGKPFTWPDGAKAAVSLSYDDAINSQLDNAIPALNRYGLKGTFNLVLSSATVSKRLAEWRQAESKWKRRAVPVTLLALLKQADRAESEWLALPVSRRQDQAESRCSRAS